ncbi:hypothetical protein [Cohnella lupini]|uniref:Uncharacterized protein n=1 Tax=Cohnella lupini TaxID=1294267 RepID=A0A3D9IWB0_9BACL|nr:hypothetical protein [Cohnella lupini]RED66123.1 hypothetical protein DFP95_101621 [Cohnella lupini]
MIWESSYWKDDLLALSKKLNKVYKTKEYDEHLAARFEKDIMLALYSVRKLSEASKLSVGTIEKNIKVKAYKNIKNVTRMNWHRIEELYDLQNPMKEDIGIQKLYNQVIHSYIFFISTDDNQIINGFFFNSDKTRNDKLYYLDLTDFDNLITMVGKDYPTEANFIYDEKIKDYKVNSK